MTNHGVATTIVVMAFAIRAIGLAAAISIVGPKNTDSIGSNSKFATTY